MSPELLDETLNPQHFDSWKRADVHSLGKKNKNSVKSHNSVFYYYCYLKKFQEIINITKGDFCKVFE